MNIDRDIQPRPFYEVEEERERKEQAAIEKGEADREDNIEEWEDFEN